MDEDAVRDAARDLLAALGEDPDRDGLQDTWQRRLPSLWQELMAGHDEEEKPAMRTFPADHDEMVVKTDIPFYSLCEHHLLPMRGEAHVAYRPDGEVVGISKLIRYTRWTARKLHSQEGLTNELADGLIDELAADGVIVVTEAEHMCESMRGVETPGTVTRTSAARGDISAQDRDEFFSAIDG